MMNWEDALRCIREYNVEIGSHTYNHESLYSLKSNHDLDGEIGSSIKEMEERIEL